MSGETYHVGDYKTMNVAEKIDFLRRVHREEISLWDDDGNDNEFWNDYTAVEDELLAHPEQFGCADLLHLMQILDDDCFEISWQFNLAKMIARNCACYGRDRIAFYLRHLQDVPENGRFHGWHFPVQWLLDQDTLPLLREALREQTPETKRLVSQILNGVDLYPEAKAEVQALLAQ